jgi:hypothetical protein
MDIYINPPREITTTIDEFKKFTYYELASFFINHKVAISKENETVYKLWTTDYEVFDICHKNWRFKHCDWYEIESAELYYCRVNNENLINLLTKKFNHLFFK